MQVWYPGRDEEEEEQRAGHLHTAPTGQVMGSLCLASQDNQGGLAYWRPSMEDTGEEDPVEGSSVRSTTETPAPQTRTTYGSEAAQSSSLDWKSQPARHVSWHERHLGERGSGGSMAVSDEGAAVGGQTGTPQLRFKGTNPTPNAGRRGIRPEGIAAPEEDSIQPSPVLPIRSMGDAKMVPAQEAEPKPGQQQVGSAPKGKDTEPKKQKVDLQNNPHLCLSAKEQIDKTRTDAVAALIGAIPWEQTTLGMPDPEGPGNLARTSDERYAAVVRAMYATGASRNKSAATMLRKIAAFLSEEKGTPVLSHMIFPIGIGLVESAKYSFENTKGSATAAKCMHVDLGWLRQLGLPVPSEEDVETSLARPLVQRPAAAGPGKPAAPNARQPICPKMVCEIEWFSVHGRFRDDPEAVKYLAEHGEHMPPPLTASGDLMPAQVYALAQWAQLAACDRGMGIWASTWDPPVDGDTAKYTACIDKHSRLLVPRVVPSGGFECESHPLIVDYSRKMVGCTLTPFFAYKPGESKHASKSDRWIGAGGVLALTPVAAKPTAMGALTSTRSYVTKVPEATLVALKMSGTHTDRHVAPEVTTELSWPEKEIAALGDWAEPSDEPKLAGTKRKKKKNFALACNSITYHHNATEKNTMASRKRFTDATRAFIARAGGYEKLTSDTLWSDIIPRKCPGPEFEQFYGPSWSESGADVIGEAAKTLSTAIATLDTREQRRSARERGTPPSKEAERP